MRMRSLLAVPAALLGAALALSVLALGAPFWLVSALTRWLASRLTPTVVRWPQLFEFDAALGWRARPHVDCHCLEERDDIFRVKTDQHGWPLGPSLADSEMVVVGDSYAWGYGVDHAASFAARLGRHVPTKAAAVPGYNLVQQFLLLERLATGLKDKLVVWFVYVGNDLHETLQPQMNGYRCPFVRQTTDGAWEIVTAHLAPEPWRTSGDARVALYPTLAALHRASFAGERAYAAAAFLLERAAALSRACGFRLVVATIPWPVALTTADDPTLPAELKALRARMDPGHPDRQLGAACERLGIPFVPLREHLTRQDFKPLDDHWTEHGHARVAATLLEVYRRHRTLPAPPAPSQPALAPAEAAAMQPAFATSSALKLGDSAP
jgi:hypothetical protein